MAQKRGKGVRHGGVLEVVVGSTAISSGSPCRDLEAAWERVGSGSLALSTQARGGTTGGEQVVGVGRHRHVYGEAGVDGWVHG